MAQPWQNRIVGYGEIVPDQALAHSLNYRIHPRPQQSALTGVLQDVGIVQNILINKRTDPSWGRDQNVETVVDGHLRIALAISAGQPTVPVTYVDLTRAEEAEILLTFDPLGAMAVHDKANLDALLREVESGDEAVQAMLADLSEQADGVILRRPGESSATKLDGASTQIRPVISVADIGVVETAIRATGEVNRGVAVVAICREYLQRHATQG